MYNVLIKPTSNHSASDVRLWVRRDSRSLNNPANRNLARKLELLISDDIADTAKINENMKSLFLLKLSVGDLICVDVKAPGTGKWVHDDTATSIKKNGKLDVDGKYC